MHHRLCMNTLAISPPVVVTRPSPVSPLNATWRGTLCRVPHSSSGYPLFEPSCSTSPHYRCAQLLSYLFGKHNGRTPGALPASTAVAPVAAPVAACHSFLGSALTCSVVWRLAHRAARSSSVIPREPPTSTCSGGRTQCSCPTGCRPRR